MQPNFLGALRFADGFMFFRVLDRSPFVYRPYDQLGIITPGSNIQTFPVNFYTAGANAISPDLSTKTDVILASNLSPTDLHDVLYLPGSPTNLQLLHGAIGVKPNRIRVYPRYPQSEAFMGKWPSLQPPQTQNGDPFAYFDGVDSPFEEPTDYRELVIIPRLHLSFVFYNPGEDSPTQPLLNLRFCLYNIQQFNPAGSPYERALIGRIARRDTPASFLTAGSAESPIPFQKAATAYPYGVIDIDAAAQIG